MTDEQIIEMAKEAGRLDKYQVFYFTNYELKAFAKLVAQHEREECAKVCDGWLHADGDRCAEAIRARGEA